MCKTKVYVVLNTIRGLNHYNEVTLKVSTSWRATDTYYA